MTVLSALPRATDPSTALMERADVVVDRGILHLLHDDLAPHEARDADLLLISAVLEEAGVETLLIRHDLAVPALVIDLRQRVAAQEALAAACSTHPLYVKAKGWAPTLACDAAAVPDSPAVLRVYRPRLTRSGGLRYGAAWGVHLEFWRFGEETVEAPRDNALTRRRTAAADISYTTVERHGRTWRTIAGMFDPHPLEVVDDIDIVFSWVDGSSSEFRRQRAAQMAEYIVGEGDDGPARYRHVDELRYALRSVHM